MTAPYERPPAAPHPAGSYPAPDPDPRTAQAVYPPEPPPGYAPHHPGYAARPPAPEHYRDDTSFTDEAARFTKQHLRTRETKEFFKTSEFLLTVLVSLVMIISAAVQDDFDAPQMWRLVTAVVAAYVLSRGIAKAGTSRDR
jgi:hypothetical protein